MEMTLNAMTTTPEKGAAAMRALFAGQAERIEPAPPLAIQPPPVRMLVVRRHGDAHDAIMDFFGRDSIVLCGTGGENLTVMDFLAAMNLAAVCAAGAPDIDPAVTLTCITRGNGACLAQNLREKHAIPVAEYAAGVYRLRGGALPAQIIDMEHIPPDASRRISSLIGMPAAEFAGANLRLVGSLDVCETRGARIFRKWEGRAALPAA